MINAILNKNLSKAYDNQLSDAVHLFTAVRENREGRVYDHVSDTYTNAPAITYGGRGTVKKYKSGELMATEIDITDVQFSCLQIECSGIPKVGDIVSLRGGTGRIMEVSPSSTDLKWVMRLRGLNVD